MKALLTRVAFFFAVYLLIAFFLVMGFTYFRGAPEGILPAFKSSYLLNETCFNYFSVFIALEISSLMVALSWAFSKTAEAEGRQTIYSMMRRLRSVLVVMLICLVLSVVATEFLRPLLKARQSSIINASADYTDFMARAEENLSAGNFAQANLYAQQAAAINPESEDAASLVAKIEQAESRFESTNVASLPQEKDENRNELNIPVAELIERARKYYENNQFFEAHYYATLALDSYNPQNVHLQDAKRLAAESWNKMKREAKRIADDSWDKLQSVDKTTSVSEGTFLQKQNGYAAIERGDYLAAYYIFRELLNGNGSDPDIKRYLRIAEENIAKNVFFIDETYDLQPFESVRDVNFSVARPDGGLIVVGLKGITAVHNSGGFIQYARGVHIVSFDKYHNLEESFYVPYAKLSAANAENLGYTYEKAVERQKKKSVPYLIITSVDRDNRDVKIKPVVYHRSKTAVINDTVYVLPMPFQDFLDITEAAQGASVMPLLSLFAFCEKADKYGFSAEVFMQTLIGRLCSPFLFTIFVMIAAIFAWKFKLKDSQLVHFWWLFCVPLFSVAAYFIVEATMYFHNLLVCGLIGAIGWTSIPTVIAIYLLFFVVLCYFFVMLKEQQPSE